MLFYNPVLRSSSRFHPLWDENFWGTRDSAEFSPACDVEDAKGHVLLTLDLPGVSKSDLKIETEGNLLHISGERKKATREEQDGTWYSERRYGRFERTFTLPETVDAGKIQANFRDGVLQVYLPKAEAARSREIPISSEEPTPGGGFFTRLLGDKKTTAA